MIGEYRMLIVFEFFDGDAFFLDESGYFYTKISLHTRSVHLIYNSDLNLLNLQLNMVIAKRCSMHKRWMFINKFEVDENAVVWLFNCMTM